MRGDLLGPPPAGPRLGQFRLAFVNGPRGGRAVGSPAPNMHEELIKESGFDDRELMDHSEYMPGEPVVHAVADASHQFAVA